MAPTRITSVNKYVCSLDYICFFYKFTSYVATLRENYNKRAYDLTTQEGRGRR